MRAKYTLAAAACGIAPYALPAMAQTDVLPGYDLFQTLSSGTSFQGQAFEGVPIGNYNFGGTIGVQNTGLTDTIIQRLSTAAIPGNSGTAAPVNLLFDDLQLESTTPTTLGGLGPLGIYYITLQSQNPAGGTASTGTIDINFTSPAGGTFTSSLDVFFDVRFGALNGPIVAQNDLVLTNAGDTWGRIPPTGAELINGANYLLNGTNSSEDFFVNPPLVETHPSGAQHTVTEAQMPEPATLGLIALASLAALSRRRRHFQSKKVLCQDFKLR